MPTQPTQTNLQLQLQLAELVQAKGLPMWESDYFTIVKDFTMHQKLKYDTGNYDNIEFSATIDLNQNRFGEWLTLTFQDKGWYTRENDIIGEYTATLAEDFKIRIALDGLTDKILQELIKEITKL